LGSFPIERAAAKGIYPRPAVRHKVMTKLRPYSIFSIFFILIQFFCQNFDLQWLQLDDLVTGDDTTTSMVTVTTTVTATATATATVASLFLLDLRLPQVHKKTKSSYQKDSGNRMGKRKFGGIFFGNVNLRCKSTQKIKVHI